MLERTGPKGREARAFPERDVAALADDLIARRRARRRRGPWFVGLSGVPGTGKSTLARQLAAELDARGHAALVLSLDDFYLGRRERARLAREVHPLFATRGPAGTHDIAALSSVLDALRRGEPDVTLPRFDRLRDRRLPPSRWRKVARNPVVVLLEGWLVGVTPLARAGLMRAPNALERAEDADGRWRRSVNDALAGDYARAWRRLDVLVALLAPDLAAMRRWRADAEHAMACERGTHGMSRAQLSRFLDHYERWAAHALRVLPELADIVWRLDRRHCPQVCSSR